MKPLVIDVESTIFQKGNPFAQRNRLCYIGVSSLNHALAIDVREYGTGLVQDEFIETLRTGNLYIGFNFKFDLHWLQREGLLPVGHKFEVWDCQVAEFLLHDQRLFLNENSLDKAAERYGTTRKSTYIEENYWSKGIDTDAIPSEEMLSYLRQDLRCTWEVYHKQQEALAGRSQAFKNLMRLHMQDLLVLQEMEYNGLKLNVDRAQQEKERCLARLEEIEGLLRTSYPNTPINFDSGDHVSAYLYGGTITVDRKEPAGVFKSGQKIGEVRYKWVEDVYHLPRKVNPIEGSELAKADKEKGTGPWSTAEDVLKQVKQIEEVKLLQERAKLTKLLDYLSGFPSLIVEKDWAAGMVHGQFNQVIARTGRLSSSNPNLQNLPDPILQLIETRYQ